MNTIERLVAEEVIQAWQVLQERKLKAKHQSMLSAVQSGVARAFGSK